MTTRYFYQTEHFDRDNEREVTRTHASWEAARSFARRMSDLSDSSATAYWYKNCESGPNETEIVKCEDYVFGELHPE